MYMLKYLLFSFISMVGLHSNAQQITGLITDGNERISEATIKNLNSSLQTITNDHGEFKLLAKYNDTLVFSKPDFLKDTMVITNQNDIVVKLIPIPMLLNEVRINSRALSPALTYEQNKKDYKDIYWKGDKSNIFLSGSLVNIDKLNNALGKQGHNARNLQHKLTKDYRDNIVDKRFNPLATRITGYKCNKLKDFILNNRPTYEK